MSFTSDNILKYITLTVIVIFIAIFTSPLLVLWRRGFNVGEIHLDYLVESFVLSFTTSLLSTLLIFLLSVPVAFTLANLMRGSLKRIIETVIMIPVIVSPSAVGSVLLLFLVINPAGSVFNELIGLLNDPKGIVAAQFLIGYPVAVSLYTVLFLNVPRVYEEVALEAGLSRLEYLYRVLLPMTKSQVISGLVLVYARVFADFGASLIVGGGIKGKTWTFPIYIYMTTQYGDLVMLSVALLLYIIIAVIVLYTLYTAREFASSIVRM